MLTKLFLFISAVGAINIRRQMPYDDDVVYGEDANMPDMSHFNQHDFVYEKRIEDETKAELRREHDDSDAVKHKMEMEEEEEEENDHFEPLHERDHDTESPDMSN